MSNALPPEPPDAAMGVLQLTTTQRSLTPTLNGSQSPHECKLSAPIVPLRRSFVSKLDHACLHLSPSFFSINMGTGITSILLYNLPYNAEWLRRLGIVVFVLNIVLFVSLVLGNVFRYVRWRGLFGTVTRHEVSSMFWGCLPMGFITIVNMIAFVCVPAWGWRWAQLALGLWWIDAIMSIGINLGMIFMMFTRQTHSAQTFSAVWLLPIVTSVVCAASGGIVASSLLPFSPALARSTILVSYVIWGTGVPIAMFITTLWLYRTIISGVPAPAALATMFLPLGPCGQGSFGIMVLGRVVRDLAYDHDLGIAAIGGDTESSLRLADAIYAGGLVTGLILWGLAMCWYILATAVIIDHWLSNRDFFFRQHFSVGLWALTFPIGVFATATTTLASELDSPAFRVIGTVLSIQVALHWIYVSVMTVWKVVDGTIFVAPEIADSVPERRWGRRDDPEEKV
ncbi:voltage-dependent anion channel-domain-containing protein [Naematelia encephala]|uniref:Voltage-dependent anion channel-domain-containing protein n=1 Tax=Naematelia encephala TaxID=71784 RepID=A0A1Y2AXY1_9TREE|nr:voltage-dependent anion channel-domain-containing protein [Naematelia encephala]